MISENYLRQWGRNIPWPQIIQVEQDLIISRALISLYQKEHIRENLAFKGGTALNKLFFKPPQRYSEDIDLAQIKSQPIGPTIAEIRSALSWLGEPKGKLTNRSMKLIYPFDAIDGVKRKLKIEINTTEHFSVYPLVEHEYSVESDWFSGQSTIKTFHLDELMGTKLKALYQRNKGRDLFDVWHVLKNNLVDCKAVINVFNHYCENEGTPVTRALFEKNLHEKKQNPDFQNDIVSLITNQSKWSSTEAFELVHENLVHLLPGKPWKSLNSKSKPLANELSTL